MIEYQRTVSVYFEEPENGNWDDSAFSFTIETVRVCMNFSEMELSEKDFSPLAIRFIYSGMTWEKPDGTFWLL